MQSHFLAQIQRAPILSFAFEKNKKQKNILRGAELSLKESEKDVFLQVYVACMPVVVW